MTSCCNEAEYVVKLVEEWFIVNLLHIICFCVGINGRTKREKKNPSTFMHNRVEYIIGVRDQLFFFFFFFGGGGGG